MNKQQKLERLKAEGYTIKENPHRSLKFTAIRKKETIIAKSIGGMFKKIFGY